MKFTFLGAGSAFTMENYQSNMIVTSDSGKNLLIDCGGDVRHSMKAAGFGVADIDAIYVSHLHSDHTSGIEWLAFNTYFNDALKQPKMFINEKLSRELWENTLQGGLGSIQGKITTLDSYFEVTRVIKNKCFIWEDIEFRLVQVIHYMDGFDIVPSYGLLFTVNGLRYFLTTDAQHAPSQIQDFYNMSDVIFQDCETTPFASGVHAHYEELITLNEETKAKMILYHYSDGDKKDCTNDGFRCWATNQMEIDLNTGTVINA